jgi:hypothetical protein
MEDLDLDRIAELFYTHPSSRRMSSTNCALRTTIP